MFRVLVLPLLGVIACREPETEPTDTAETATDSDPPPPPTDTDPSTDLFAPPTGIVEACWSWQVEFEGASTLRERTLRVHNPATLDVTHLEKDRDAEGLMDYFADFQYDPLSGDLIARQIDDDGDAIVDETTRWIYDAQGLLVELSVDRDGDGARDSAWTYVYDDAGSRLTASEDVNGDSVADTVVTYTYDDAGRTIRIDDDAGNDGALDNITTFTYEDEAGPDVTVVHDDGNDGLVDLVERLTHDAQGRLSHYEQDLDNGFSTLDDHSYTADGDLSTYEREIYYDDEWAQYEHWGYTYLGPQKPLAVIGEYFTVQGAASPALTVQSDYTWTCP